MDNDTNVKMVTVTANPDHALVGKQVVCLLDKGKIRRGKVVLVLVLEAEDLGVLGIGLHVESLKKPGTSYPALLPITGVVGLYPGDEAFALFMAAQKGLRDICPLPEVLGGAPAAPAVDVKKLDDVKGLPMTWFTPVKGEA